MRETISIAIKDLILLSRDKMGMFFILVFPILMGLFFGLVMGGTGGGGGSRTMQLAIVDEDQSEISKQFSEVLRKNEAVDLMESTRENAIDQVRRGRWVGLIVVPKGFGETAGLPWKTPPTLEIGMDPSKQAEAGMAQGLVMQSMGQMLGKRFGDPSQMRNFVDDLRGQIEQENDMPLYLRPLLNRFATSLDDMFANLERIQMEEAKNDSESESNAGFSSGFQFANIENIDVTYTPEPGSIAAQMRKTRSPWDITFPQAMLWGVLGCISGFAVSFVRERTQGTMIRLQVAPISSGQILLGKALGCFLSVVGVLTVLTLLGWALGMRPRSPLLLATSILIVAFSFVGIMMLMSILGKTEEAVGGASWGVNMIMAMFGGAMIPAMFMPSFMKTISHLSPVKWAILSLEGSIWRGFTLAEMLKPYGILLGIGVAAMLIGVRALKQNEGAN